MQCPQCGTLLNPSDFESPGGQGMFCPRCGTPCSTSTEFAPHQSPPTGFVNSIVHPQVPDPWGLAGVICGGIGLFCLVLACPTCGITLYPALPLTVAGAVCSFLGRGNRKLAGLIMNLIVLIPAVILSVILGIAILERHEEAGKKKPASGVITPEKEPTEADVPAAVPKYSTLMGEDFSGSGFHFRWDKRRYIGCSLHQFEGKKPSTMMSLDFDESIKIVDQVHKQQDAQVLTYLSKELDAVPSLEYAGSAIVQAGDTVVLLFNERRIPGELLGRAPNQRHLLQFRAKHPFEATGCSGAPVVSGRTGKVVGVALTADDPAKATVIGFELLDLPANLH